MYKLITHAALMLLTLWLGGAACAGTVTYIYTDAQGTPLAEADADGNIIAQFDYTPYGAPVPIMGPAPDGPGYTGHVNDPDTGLVYMQARYYDPAVGRFLSVDPVGSTPGNTFSFNRYNYANNNPHKFVDPDGREAGFVYMPDGGMRHFYNDHAPNPAAASFAADFTPGIGDAKAIGEAIAEPSALNITAAAVGMVPLAGDAVAKVLKTVSKAIDTARGTAGGERAGKGFTARGKLEIDAANAGQHGGVNVCENCGREVVPGQRSERGVSPPGSERQRDHIIPKSKGGDGDPSNGQILCRDCNLRKGDKT